MLDMFTRGLLEKKYAQQDEQNAINRMQAQNLGLLQTAQAGKVTMETGLLPRSVESENAFRDANTQTVRAGLPFIAPRAKAEIGGILANTGLTNQRTVTERYQPRLIMSSVGLNNANARSIRSMLMDTGLELPNVMYGLGLGGLLGPRQ